VTRENIANLVAQLEIPVLMAPMFLVSGPELVIAGCKEGVIGSFPLSNARTLEDLEGWMDRIVKELAAAREQNPEKRIAPWAVNLAVHRTNIRLEEEKALIRKYQPPIVITSLGNPGLVTELVHDYGGLVFADVVNLNFARKAAERGADGLILVCNGAGGHGGQLNPFAFMNAVKEFWDGITILAGCISSGRDIAAAMMMGADLVSMGTRFIAAEESMVSPEYRNMLIESTIEDIIYTDVFSGVPGNYLIPSIRKAGLDPEHLPSKESFNWSRNHEQGPKPWKNIWSAGQGVGVVKRVQPVAELIAELKREYQLLQPPRVG
jgi:nitronate monooxygenase